MAKNKKKRTSEDKQKRAEYARRYAEKTGETFRSGMADLTDKTKAGIIIFIIAVFSFLNIFLYVFSHSTGSLRVQTVTDDEQTVTISVKGIAIRDEVNVSQKDTNQRTSEIKKPNGVCEPVIEDGDYVSYMEKIAHVFSSENARDAYVQYKQALSDLDSLKKLEKFTSGSVNIDAANLLLTNYLSEYADHSKSGEEKSDRDAYLQELAYHINTRTKPKDLETSIATLEAKVEGLKNSSTYSSDILSPSAGYFVNEVDGCEKIYDYKDISTNGIKADALKDLLKSAPLKNENYFGKIVYQNNWYFAFNVSAKFAGEYLKRGDKITVSFPQKGISDITMYVSRKQRTGDTVAVSCRCPVVSPEILHLRVEKAVITAKNITGNKIPKDALVTMNDIQGVYVKVGNRAIFKPVNIRYSEKDYAIVKSLTWQDFAEKYGEPKFKDLLSKNGAKLYTYKISQTEGVFKKNPKLSKEARQTLDLLYKQMYAYDRRELTDYDQIITKGRNLYDGKFIS